MTKPPGLDVDAMRFEARMGAEFDSDIHTRLREPATRKTVIDDLLTLGPPARVALRLESAPLSSRET